MPKFCSISLGSIRGGNPGDLRYMQGRIRRTAEGRVEDFIYMEPLPQIYSDLYIRLSRRF